MGKTVRSLALRCGALLVSITSLFILLGGTAMAHPLVSAQPDGMYLGGDHMLRGGYFDLTDGGGDYLLSQPQERYKLVFQPDGNLVEYDQGNSNHVVWASGTNGKGATTAQMQTDGNFVIYNGSCALWATGTNNPSNPGYELKVNSNGSVTILNAGGSIIVSTPNLGSVRHCN